MLYLNHNLNKRVKAVQIAHLHYPTFPTEIWIFYGFGDLAI